MSWYISNSVLTVDGYEAPWNHAYNPGDTVPVSGLYRCLGCKKEIASNQGDPFPAQNHHQHGPSQGKVRWTLNVRANSKGT